MTSLRSGQNSQPDSKRFIRLLWLGVAVLNLLVAVLAVHHLHSSWRSHIERARISTENLSMLLEREIAGDFEKVDLALKNLVDDHAENRLANKLLAEVWNSELRLQRSHLPILSGIRATDASGTVIYGLNPGDPQHASVADRDYFRMQRDNPQAGLLISQPVLSRVTGKWSLVLSRRLTGNGGKFAGIVAATVPLEHFRERFTSIKIGDLGSIAMRDDDLHMILRLPELSDGGQTGSTRIASEFKAALMRDRDAGSYVAGASSIDGVPRFHSYRRNPVYHFYINVGVADKEYLATWHGELLPTGALVCVFLLVTVVFAGQLHSAWTRQQDFAAQMMSSEVKYHQLFEQANDGIFLLDETGFVDCNHHGAQLYGLTKEQLIGRTPAELCPERQPNGLLSAEMAAEKIAAGMKGATPRFEWQALHADGTTLDVEISLSRVVMGGKHYLQAIVRDITARRQAEEEIKHLAFYDPLTQLPNRRLLLDRLMQALASSKRSGRFGALLFIDLDNFKMLNDTLGHDIGDLLLQQVGERLSTCVRAGDTVARLGGDEFVVMLEDLSESAREAATITETVAEKVLATLSATYQLAGYQQRSTPSIGATLFGHNDDAVEELLKRADLAMYQAKAAGRNTMRFFDPEMQAVVSARAAMEAGLTEAMRKEQFLIYFQAQVDGAGKLTGAEVLLRWQHPQQGLVSPLEFIPLAEDTGLIRPLGQWVLEAACTQLAAWAGRAEMAHFTLAVNVSALQFHEPDFVEQVLKTLEQTGANPHLLKLELTESLLVSNVEDVIAKMTALKAKGVGFALDDFGTGYSSLSYLKRLPLDQLKIDRGFVRDILTDPNDASIAKMVVALAQSLDLAVIAEGVEIEAQKNFLARHGCLAYQGFLFSRPLPIGEFERFVLAG
ncbi:MAG: EAL domain-containing protein [Betaproteobacteria bacterium]|nr:EAL domain-containing protein [Betaproteobacteria bacterium]